jgi:hypothetical protein
MTQYRCFYSRYVGDVSEFIIIDAETDTLASLKADSILRSHDNYEAVEMFTDGQLLGQIERLVAPTRGSAVPAVL